MRVALGKGAFRSVLRSLERVLLLVGVALLACCAFVLWDAAAFQRQQELQLQALMRDQPPPRSAARIAPRPLSAAAEEPSPVAVGDLIGRIDIARLGLSVIVVEGVDNRTLRRAAGHIPGTELPGRPGNVGIAGHRDTYFHPLEQVLADDVIVFSTGTGEYRYRVVSKRVVGPDDVAVLDHPGPGEVLTLVTCHPFYFVGPAPNRFVVRAERF